MNKPRTLTRGFTAEKNGVTFEIETVVYDIGFYIKTYTDGKLINMTTRNTLNKAETLVMKERGRLLHKGWRITDDPIQHKVIRNPETLRFTKL